MGGLGSQKLLRRDMGLDQGRGRIGKMYRVTESSYMSCMMCEGLHYGVDSSEKMSWNRNTGGRMPGETMCIGTAAPFGAFGR